MIKVHLSSFDKCTLIFIDYCILKIEQQLQDELAVSKSSLNVLFSSYENKHYR